MIKVNIKLLAFVTEPQRTNPLLAPFIKGGSGGKGSSPFGAIYCEGLRSYGESTSLPVRTLPGTFGRLPMQRYPPL